MTSHTMPLAEAATQIATKFKAWVFPCNADKSPACRGGHRDAANDPEEIRRLFAAAPNATLVGVWLKKSGLVAIDWDAYKPDADAHEWVEQWADLLNAARCHLTPKGGYHYIFGDPAGETRFPGGLFTSVDIKYDGYVIWPTPGTGYSIKGGRIRTLPEELMGGIREAVALTRARTGGKGEGVALFGGIEDALDALAKDPQHHRHEAILTITRRLAVEEAGWTTAQIVEETSGLLNEAIGDWLQRNDPHRGAEVLDTREGGEIWRAAESAREKYGAMTIDPIVEKFGAALVDRLGGPSPAVTVSVADIPKAAAEAEVRRLKDRDDPFRTLADHGRDPTKAPPVRWLFGEFIARGYVTLMTADPGAGKTTWAMTAAASMASGKPFFGGEVYQEYDDDGADLLPPGSVYIGEDHDDDLTRRAFGFRVYHDLIGDEVLEEGFAVAPAHKVGVKLTMMVDGVAQANEGGYIYIRDKLAEMDAALLILDPMVTFNGGSNENDAQQMSVFMQQLTKLAEELGLAVLLVHHTTKEGSSGRGVNNPFTLFRGSTVVLGAVRVAFALVHCDEEEWGVPIRTVGIKSNVGDLRNLRHGYRLHAVELGNATRTYPKGTTAPAMEWICADPMPRVDQPLDLRFDVVIAQQIHAGIEAGYDRYSTSAREGLWIGDYLINANPDWTEERNLDDVLPAVRKLLKEAKAEGCMHMVQSRGKNVLRVGPREVEE